MSPLTQSLIQTINTEHAAQLAAVEESLTRIEEAETLAATLRHHGVTEARAFGFAVGGDGIFSQARIHLNVSAAGCPPDILTQALRAAELRVSHIQHRHSDGHDYLHLVGIDCPICAKAAACADAAIQLSEVPA